MRLAEYYLTHHGEIDLSNCNNIPDAPRVAGHNSSDETTTKKEPGKREGRSTATGATSAVPGKKGRSKSKKSKSGDGGAAADTAKVDKALYTLTGKNISTEQVINPGLIAPALRHFFHFLTPLKWE